jgi:5-oxoprolinase (ATP-hydrolysing) subunit A
MNSIDINCDMGEIPEAVTNGTQEALMPFLTSVNIACGGHAGDANTMAATIQQALRWKLAIGAHPGYPDRANFGRLELDLPPEVVAESVFHQVKTLAAIAATFSVHLTHVKPHGALYNQAVHNQELAAAIAQGVARWKRNAVLVGLADSPMLQVFRQAGFSVAAEAFADRRYESDGTLRSRKFADALIRDPAEAAKQALGIADSGTAIAAGGSPIAVIAQTICIHSDTPGAVQIAEAVATTLQSANIAIRAVAP